MILAVGDSPSPASTSTVGAIAPVDCHLVGVDLSVIGISGTGQFQAQVSLNSAVGVPSVVALPEGSVTHLACFAGASASKFAPLPSLPIKAGQVIYLHTYAGPATTGYAAMHLHLVTTAELRTAPGAAPPTSEPRGSAPRLGLQAGPGAPAPPPEVVTPPGGVTGGETGPIGSAILKQRVIRGDRAAACCRKNQIKVLQKANQVILDCFNIIENIQRDEQIVMAGGVLGVAPSVVSTAAGATPFEQLLARPVASQASSEFYRLIQGSVRTVRALPKGAGFSPGSVAILVGVTSAQIFLDVAARTAALETLSLVGGAITTGLRYEPDSCTQCVLDNALPQTASRQRQRTKILRRLGGANP